MYSQAIVVGLISSHEDNTEAAASYLETMGFERFSLMQPVGRAVEQIFGIYKTGMPRYIRETPWGNESYYDHIAWLEEQIVEAHGDEFFLARLKHALAGRPSRYARFVITDIRRPLEASYVLNTLGGIVLRVETRAQKTVTKRMSNAQWPMIPITREFFAGNTASLVTTMKALFDKPPPAAELELPALPGTQREEEEEKAQGKGQYPSFFERMARWYILSS